METLLVLTDFSKAADYAVSYACMMARQLRSHAIVLYHSYYVPVPMSEAATWTIDDDSMRQSALQNLKDLEASIVEKIPQGVILRHRTDAIGLEDIDSVAVEEKADIIVMGTTGKTKLEEILVGSNAINVCKNSDYPVLLIPAYTELRPAEQIVFACDMNEVEETIPIDKFKKILDRFNLPLAVLNVDDRKSHFNPDDSVNIRNLHDLLKSYNPGYYNINSEDVVKGISEFAKQRPSIVLLITRTHNFMESLFYRSVTRRLAYTTTFPVLVLREQLA